MSAPAYRLQSVCAQLGGREVLHDLGVQLPAARWTSIVGPNGAGKSTLLRVLAGLQTHQGRVELLGQPLSHWSPRQRAQSLAWLGQNEGAADDLRAYDVVMLGRLPHQPWLAPASETDHAAVEAAMRQTQTWAWRERSLGMLSGGERQRVLLARALAVQAAIVLMDEPLMHLDPPHQADWLSVVRELVQSGTTVLSVLHEIPMALQAQDVLVMDQGRIVHQGASHDTTTHRALEQVFAQRIAIERVGTHWVSVPRL